MPIMSACKCPEKFPSLLIGAVSLVTAMYIIFSEVCYFSYGANLTEPIMLQQMPSDSLVFQLMRLLFCINCICTFPLVIYPVNTILESYILPKGKETPMRKKFKIRRWLKNILRCIVVTTIVFVAVALSKKLDKFVAILGALLCAPLAFLLPTLCHLKIVAVTKT